MKKNRRVDEGGHAWCGNYRNSLMYSFIHTMSKWLGVDQ